MDWQSFVVCLKGIIDWLIFILLDFPEHTGQLVSHFNMCCIVSVLIDCRSKQQRIVNISMLPNLVGGACLPFSYTMILA